MAHTYEVGEYRCRVTRQGFSESKQKSTPFFFLEVEFLSAKGPNQMPAKAYKRTLDWYITEGTFDFVMEKLRSLGWQGSKFSELDPASEGHHSFVGDEVNVYVKHDGDYDQFDLSFTPAGGVEEKAGLSSKLDKLFGKALMASAKKTAPKPKKQEPPAGAAEADDEVPF